MNDCGRRHYARGWCEVHYKRWRAGRPIEGEIQERLANDVAPVIRILARFLDPDACWIWPGAQFTNGYGEIRINRKPHPVHRVVYEGMVGPIPDGQQVLHHCDTPLCCNPRHLFTGTQRDNMIDMMSKNRGRGQFKPHDK
jgi:hypothetical protein